MTYTSTYVTCRDCGHRLVEMTGEGAERPRARRESCTGYECPVDDYEAVGVGKIGGGGCGARFDLDGNCLP